MLDANIREAIENIYNRDFKEKIEAAVGRPVTFRVSLDNNRYFFNLQDTVAESRWGGFPSIANGYLTPQPGCCGLIISHNSAIATLWQGKGIGGLMNKLRLKVAAYLGYGTVICTDVAKNEPQNKLLAKNGWTKVHDFKNPRTGNIVNIHVVKVG